MAITHVGSRVGGMGANLTSGTWSLPSGWLPDDVGVFVWWSRDVRTNLSVNAAITQKRTASTSAVGHIWIGYRRLQSGDGASLTWTADTSTNNTDGFFVSVFRGVQGTGDPFVQESGAPASFTNTQNPNPPSTTCAAGDTVVTVLGKNNDIASTLTSAPASFSHGGLVAHGTSTPADGSFWETTGGTDGSSGLAYRTNVPSTTEDPGAWSIGGASTDDGYYWTGAMRPEQQGTFTANAVIKKTISGTLTADAVAKKAGLPGSFTADAVIQKTITIAGVGGETPGPPALNTLDAYITAGAQTITVETTTADAVVQKEISGAAQSFTADAISLVTRSGAAQSFTADAILAKVVLDDPFTRTVSTGLGTSPEGYAWRFHSFWNGLGEFVEASVDGSKAILTAGSATRYPQYVGVPYPKYGTVQFDFLVDSFAAGGSIISIPGEIEGVYVNAVSVQSYDATIWRLVLVDGGGGSNPYYSFAPTRDEWWRAKALFRVDEGIIRAKVWKVGETEPDWQIEQAKTGTPLSFNFYETLLVTGTTAGDSTALDNLVMKTFQPDWMVRSVVTADAVRLRETPDSLSADAVLFKEVPGSFSADAVFFKTIETSATADAVLFRADMPGSATADAVLLREITSSLASDAVIYKEQAGSLTSDAVLWREMAGSATLDAVLWREISGAAQTFTADAAIAVTIPGSLTSDAVLSRTMSGSATADAVTKRTISGSLSADAVLLKTITPGGTTTVAQDDFSLAYNPLSGNPADIGGNWSVASSNTPNIRTATGRIRMFPGWIGAAGWVEAYLSSVSARDVDAYVTAYTEDNGAFRNGVVARRGTTTGYMAFWSNADGKVHVARRSGTSSWTSIASVTKASPTPAKVRLVATGANPTSLQARIWSGAEPGTWDVETTDSAGPQAAGQVGLWSEAEDDGYDVYLGYVGDDLLVTAGTAALVADAWLLRPQSSSLSANAVIKRNQTGSLTADAVTKRAQTGSATADAVIQREATSSLTADAILYGTAASSLTADAVLFRADMAGAFDADAVLLRAQEGTFTADASVAVVIPGSFTADAITLRTIPGSVAADAVIKRTQAGTFTADAVTKRNQTGSLTADAEIIVGVVTVPGDFTSDAVLLRTAEGTLSANAWVFGAGVGAFGADAVLWRQSSATFAADAVIARATEATLGADAITMRSAASSLTADAIVQRTMAGASLADAIVQRARLVSFTADAICSRQITSSVTADAVLLAGRTAVLPSDAILASPRTGGWTADAAIHAPVAQGLPSDAVIRRTTSSALTADAVLRTTTAQGLLSDATLLKVASGSFSADAEVAEAPPHTLTADAVLARTEERTVLAQAVTQRLFQGELDVDAIIRAPHVGTLLGDATLHRPQAGSLTATAIVRQSYSGVYQADAIARRSQAGSFTADAILGALAFSFTADAVINSLTSRSVTADAVLGLAYLRPIDAATDIAMIDWASTTHFIDAVTTIVPMEVETDA